MDVMQANRVLPSVAPFCPSRASQSRVGRCNARQAGQRAGPARDLRALAAAEGGLAEFAFNLEELEANTGEDHSLTRTYGSCWLVTHHIYDFGDFCIHFWSSVTCWLNTVLLESGVPLHGKPIHKIQLVCDCGFWCHQDHLIYTGILCICPPCITGNLCLISSSSFLSSSATYTKISRRAITCLEAYEIFTIWGIVAHSPLTFTWDTDEHCLRFACQADRMVQGDWQWYTVCFGFVWCSGDLWKPTIIVNKPSVSLRKQILLLYILNCSLRFTSKQRDICLE